MFSSIFNIAVKGFSARQLDPQLCSGVHAGLCANDIHFDPNPRVQLHGKGDKWRVCPLWAETAALLQKLLSEHVVGAAPDRPVFTSPRRTALTRFGIYKIVRRYTTEIVKRGSDGELRRVSPHKWRHYLPFRIMSCSRRVSTGLDEI